jgi:aminoacrylate hydrolase
MPTADIRDAPIYYERHGSGPPVMLVAGLGGVGSYWRDLIPALRDEFEMILHDHRGTGRRIGS